MLFHGKRVAHCMMAKMASSAFAAQPTAPLEVLRNLVRFLMCQGASYECISYGCNMKGLGSCSLIGLIQKSQH